MSKILVTGSGKGLGSELVEKLRSDGHDVFKYDIGSGKDVRKPDLKGIEELDILINNAAVNIIDWLENFTEEQWTQLYE